MGVARALIDDAMSILCQQGILTLEVTANPHALAFYEAAGFEITGSTTTPLGPGWRMRLAAQRVQPNRRRHPTGRGNPAVAVHALVDRYSRPGQDARIAAGLPRLPPTLGT